MFPIQNETSTVDRAGGVHYHAPGRPSPMCVLKRSFGRVGSAPSRGKRLVAPSSAPPQPPPLEREPPPKRVPSARCVSAKTTQLDARLRARRIKEEYFSKVVRDSTRHHAVEVNVADYVTQPGPGLAEIGRDVPSEPITVPCKAAFETSLLQQVDALKKARSAQREAEGKGFHTERHAEPLLPSVERITECDTLLDALVREVRGPIKEFLMVMKSEYRVGLFNEQGHVIFDRYAAMRKQLALLEKSHRGLTEKCATLSAENDTLKASTSGESGALRAARERVADLEAAEKTHLGVLQRSKDHTDFLNNQIDELQEALNKATQRLNNVSNRRASAAPRSLVDVISESDREIASVLAFSDPTHDNPDRACGVAQNTVKTTPTPHTSRPISAKKPPKVGSRQNSVVRNRPYSGGDQRYKVADVQVEIPSQDHYAGKRNTRTEENYTARSTPSTGQCSSTPEVDVTVTEKTHRFSVESNAKTPSVRQAVSFPELVEGSVREMGVPMEKSHRFSVESGEVKTGQVLSPRSSMMDFTRLTADVLPVRNRQSVASSISTFHASEVSVDWEDGDDMQEMMPQYPRNSTSQQRRGTTDSELWDFIP